MPNGKSAIKNCNKSHFIIGPPIVKFPAKAQNEYKSAN